MTIELGIVLFDIVVWIYVAAALCYVIGLSEKRTAWAKAGTNVLTAGLVLHTAALVVRTVAAERPPFLNLYEYVLSLVWGAVVVYLALEWMAKNRTFGAFAVPLIAIFAGMATLLPTEVNPTMPALRSAWRIPHIGTAVLAYAAFGIAFALGIVYLIREAVEGQVASFWARRLPTAEAIDQITYRVIALGFLMQTAMLITGAVWAQFAWGRYWGWDPKETWGLITWLIYAAYLHTHTTMGWRGHRSALVAIIGFIAVIFTLLGVSYLLPGLHSYAS